MAGNLVAGSFIVGQPTETGADFQETKDFISEACLNDVFVIAEPIPETPLAQLVLKTPVEANPAFQETTGEYRSLGLTESEARCFNLMKHADMYKPLLHAVTDQVFDVHVKEAKEQGSDARSVTDLLFRYYRGD